MIEEFDREEYLKLAFPIYGIENIFERFPKLKELFPQSKISEKNLDVTKVVKYIIYCYDKESPLVKKVEDVVKRKVHGAALAGFPSDNGEFEAEVNEMMKCEIPEINKMIIKYCCQMKSRLFTLCIVSHESYKGTMTEILGYKIDQENILEDHKKKMDLIAKAETLANNIDRWQRELLSQDVKLEEQLYTLIDESDLMLSPEENSREDGE